MHVQSVPVRRMSAEERQVWKIAQEYEQRGYRVVVGPSQDQVPEFLKSFQPDLIAIGPDESVVVEVKLGEEVRRSRHWAELARAVEQQPGWRFELVVRSRPDTELKQTIPVQKIRSHLDLSKRLSSQGELEGAFLLAWAALEASMRKVSEQSKLDQLGMNPATIIANLYMDGALSRREYDDLQRILSIRNRVVHGAPAPEISEGTIGKVRDITLHLLAQ